jgi:hypothetical protein
MGKIFKIIPSKISMYRQVHSPNFTLKRADF